LRNLCRHYGCSVKGNKKELVHKLLLKDGFLNDYLNHNLPKFGGVGQMVVVKHE
jgi:Rieske Fe-S protein